MLLMLPMLLIDAILLKPPVDAGVDAGVFCGTLAAGVVLLFGTDRLWELARLQRDREDCLWLGFGLDLGLGLELVSRTDSLSCPLCLSRGL